MSKKSALVIERNVLARLLQQVTKVVNSRNTIPILDTVRLSASGGNLTVTATDLDIEISCTTECDGEIGACVNARLLSGIVNKIPADAKVTIAEDGDDITVKSGRSRFKLPTLPMDDYPSMEVGDFSATFSIDLAAAVDPVAFAMSSEVTRYYLCGAYLHTEDDKIVAVATDGHRLARNAGGDGNVPAGVILPSKLVGIIPGGEVTLSVSSAKVRVETSDTTITSRVVDGTYPDYQRIIPKENNRVATVDRDSLLSAVSRVAVVSSERGRGVRLDIGDEKISLAVHGDGEADDEVAASWEGESLTIGFNADYLAEVLGGFPSGDIEIALDDGGKPALFTSKAAEGVLVILMPMRV